MIEYIGLLPTLFEKVVLPNAVKAELADPAAPRAVRAWIASPPQWIDLREAPGDSMEEEGLNRLDPGEKAAIRLALLLGGDLLLMDDRQGVLTARRKGLGVIGTIGILDLPPRADWSIYPRRSADFDGRISGVQNPSSRRSWKSTRRMAAKANFIPSSPGRPCARAATSHSGIKDSMTTDERLGRLTGIVDTLAAGVLAHDSQIESLIAVAEKPGRRHRP